MTLFVSKEGHLKRLIIGATSRLQPIQFVLSVVLLGLFVVPFYITNPHGAGDLVSQVEMFLNGRFVINLCKIIDFLKFFLNISEVFMFQTILPIFTLVFMWPMIEITTGHPTPKFKEQITSIWSTLKLRF